MEVNKQYPLTGYTSHGPVYQTTCASLVVAILSSIISLPELNQEAQVSSQSTNVLSIRLEFLELSLRINENEPGTPKFPVHIISKLLNLNDSTNLFELGLGFLGFFLRHTLVDLGRGALN